MRIALRVLVILIPAAICVAALVVPRFRSPPDPHEILERAITAHGGSASLAETRIGQVKGKVTASLPPPIGEMSMDLEEVFDFPQRHKRVMKGKTQGRDFNMSYTYRDGKWLVLLPDGQLDEKEAPSPNQTVHYASVIAQLMA